MRRHLIHHAEERGGNFAGRTAPPTPADLPVRPPNTDFRDNDWNQIETFLETNVIRTFLNDGREIGGAVDGESALSGYGPIALYVGGTGEVRFKDVMYKDISYPVYTQRTVIDSFQGSAHQRLLLFLGSRCCRL